MTYVFAGAVRNLPGFSTHNLGEFAGGSLNTVVQPNGGSDDGSSGAVSIGFTINFYGKRYTQCWVNNNGNITFSSALPTYTPFGLTGGVPQPIIAPFFADVDTRAGNVLTWGNDMVDGHQSFGVTWIQVGYYGNRYDKLNTFQLILISRSDRAPGDFDIEFNIDSTHWETGGASGGVDGFGGNPAHSGFSNGSGLKGTFYELPGSGVAGSFLDSNYTTGLRWRSLNSSQPGRYRWTVTQGEVITPSPPIWTIPTGDLLGVVTSGGVAVAQADVTLVDGQATQSTAPYGNYEIDRIPLGDYSALFSKRGYYPLFAQVTIEALRQTVYNASLVALSGDDLLKGFVAGWVVDAVSQEPLYGVSVSAQPPAGDPTVATTDINGAFILKLLPGTYTITASDAGYQSLTILHSVASAGDIDILGELALFPLTGSGGDCAIVGYVADAITGAAIAGATVSLVELPGFMALSLSDGFYELRGLPAQVLTVAASKSAYRTRYCKVETLPAQDLRVDLGLLASSAVAGSVDGYVSDCGSSVSIAGAVVKVVGIAQTLTDVNGYYVLNDLPVT